MRAAHIASKILHLSEQVGPFLMVLRLTIK